MSEIAIETDNLTKYYGEILAVDHISFEVRKGEIFGFLGPNGAGKTTTIRMLTGLTPPTEGTAKIFGYDVVKETLEAKKRIGIVPETSNVYDDLSAWDNLIFSGELYGVSREQREKRAKDLLEMFGLYERRKNKVKGFSKGMKRKLTIAMGLVNDPELLFLDEPTSGLDVSSARTIKHMIKRLNDQGMTIFLTTHNIEEANLICDRVAIINKGRIAAIDTPEKLKRTIESVQSVVVAFNSSTPKLIEGLRGLPTVNEVLKQGDKFRLYTSDPSTVIEELWKFTNKNGLRIISLNTLGPSLEDVFLVLTEGTLREGKF